MDHKFQFDKNRKRAELCPCGKSNKDKKFSPYKGYSDKGHCHSCGITFHPENKDDNFLNIPWKEKEVQPKEPDISYINLNVFNKSLCQFDFNNFVTYLKSVFNADLVDGAISKYKIGTSKHWPGATVFWQLDNLGNARTGKIMLYDKISGKRVKIPNDHISWVHSVLKLNDFRLGQVFFGTHLARPSINTIAIVESEKTAIIASICFPNITWLAAGSKDGLKIEKFKSLKNRNIILYPDANAFALWSTFAQKHCNTYALTVSSLLNKTLSTGQQSNGEDIADFLLGDIPQHLQPNDLFESNGSYSCHSGELDPLKILMNKNPSLGILIDKLGISIDPTPSDNDKWQNDIPSTIRKVGMNILPNKEYYIDEIKTLIKTHHSALIIDFDNVIRQLINNQVIVQNVFNYEYYYKYGSTPF